MRTMNEPRHGPRLPSGPPKLPAAPRGLATDGKRLWRAVWTQYELSATEAVRLRGICELADVRRALLGEAGKGAVVEVRRLTVEIDRLLLNLGVGGDGDQQRHDRSAAARAMVGERWRRQQARDDETRRQYHA
jgi:hypothetical protein